jgi:transposase
VPCGILFVLYTGIRWEWLPNEIGFGCGMACWRRLRDWNNARVWQRLHQVLVDELRAAGKLRAVVDTAATSGRSMAVKAAPQARGPA